MKTVYFGVTNPDNSTLVNILRGLQHVEEDTSHDIITYDTYLQPLLDPGIGIGASSLTRRFH